MESFNQYTTLFLDVDKTIYDTPNKRISDSALDAIKKARNVGMTIILCTSRTYCSLKNLKIIDTIQPDGIICASAGYAEYKKETKIDECFSNVQKENMLKLINDFDLTAEIVTKNENYIGNSRKNLSQESLFPYFDKWKDPIPNKNYQDSQDNPIYAIMLFELDSNPNKSIILQNIEDQKLKISNFEGMYNITFSTCDKGEKLENYINLCKIDKNKSIAIGDSLEFDGPMFSKVALGILLDESQLYWKENKSEEIKETERYNYRNVKYIVPNTKINGLYYALQKLGIIDSSIEDQLKILGICGVSTQPRITLEKCLKEYDGNLSILGVDCWSWVDKGEKGENQQKLEAKLKHAQKHSKNFRCLLLEPSHNDAFTYFLDRITTVEDAIRHRDSYLRWIKLSRNPKFKNTFELRFYQHKPTFSMRILENENRISLEVLSINEKQIKDKNRAQNSTVIEIGESNMHRWYGRNNMYNKMKTFYDFEFEKALNVSNLTSNLYDYLKMKANIKRLFRKKIRRLKRGKR